MGIEEVIFSEGAIICGWDWSNVVVQIEPLHEVTYITYCSQSAGNIRNVEINCKSREIIPDSGGIPKDFYSLASALYNEVTQNSPRNKHEQKWGVERYRKIVNALSTAKECLQPAKTEEGNVRFSFNPDSLFQNLTGNLNRNYNQYSIDIYPRQVKVESEKINIERSLNFSVSPDNTITATINYYYNGEKFVNVVLERIPNDSTVLAKKITRHFNSEEHFLRNFLKD